MTDIEKAAAAVLDAWDRAGEGPSAPTGGRPMQEVIRNLEALRQALDAK